MVMVILLTAVSIAICNSAEIHHIQEKSSCPVKGQIFQKCAACPATCSEPDLICTEQCTPGCGCPTGELIDTLNNKCVKSKQCPLPSKCALVLCAVPNCLHTAVPPGQCCPVCVCQTGGRTYFPGGSFKQDCNTCTCTSTGLIACTKIACRSDGLQRKKKKAGPLCTIPGQVYTPCSSGCPLTCNNGRRGPVLCPPHRCIPGCECRNGLVLDELLHKCVTPAQCHFI